MARGRSSPGGTSTVTGNPHSLQKFMVPPRATSRDMPYEPSTLLRAVIAYDRPLCKPIGTDRRCKVQLAILRPTYCRIGGQIHVPLLKERVESTFEIDGRIAVLYFRVLH